MLTLFLISILLPLFQEKHVIQDADSSCGIIKCWFCCPQLSKRCAYSHRYKVCIGDLAISVSKRCNLHCIRSLFHRSDSTKVNGTHRICSSPGSLRKIPGQRHPFNEGYETNLRKNSMSWMIAHFMLAVLASSLWMNRKRWQNLPLIGCLWQWIRHRRLVWSCRRSRAPTRGGSNLERTSPRRRQLSSHAVVQPIFTDFSPRMALIPSVSFSHFQFWTRHGILTTLLQPDDFHCPISKHSS
jgi:hypothetical protein